MLSTSYIKQSKEIKKHPLISMKIIILDVFHTFRKDFRF